ncbi:Galectin-4 [Halotydeus destructor]|nr:Galectin-4 [Halotydeus destructor]
MLVHEPVIPYIGLIDGGLHAGSRITIKGHSTGFLASHFSVNLVQGFQDTVEYVAGADIALHFNPRFEGKDKIVMNYRVAGIWGTEAKEAQDLPIKDGKQFKLEIFVEPVFYRISINGEHFATFNHHIAIWNVGLLHIDGAVKVDTIKVRQPDQAQFGGPLGHCPDLEMPGPFQELTDPVLPVLQPLVNGLRIGDRILITGTFSDDGKRFVVNLVTGEYPEGTKDFKDIALHFNPRHCQDDNFVVLNSRHEGEWGEEQRHPSDGNIEVNGTFRMLIEVDEQFYRICVNSGSYMFNHRAAFSDVRYVNIYGDVQVHSVKYPL